MDTKPPIFKEAAEPLDAEEWIWLNWNVLIGYGGPPWVCLSIENRICSSSVTRTCRDMVEASSHYFSS
jgi:hypothetical protein